MIHTPPDISFTVLPKCPKNHSGHPENNKPWTNASILYYLSLPKIKPLYLRKINGATKTNIKSTFTKGKYKETCYFLCLSVRVLLQYFFIQIDPERLICIPPPKKKQHTPLNVIKINLAQPLNVLKRKHNGTTPSNNSPPISCLLWDFKKIHTNLLYPIGNKLY